MSQEYSPEYIEALTYATDEPDVISLKQAYDETLINIEDYLDQCRVSYDDRHEIWPGKNLDHRKHGAAAFPWEGASDLETRTVESKIRTYVSIMSDSMHRSHIQAYPVETSDAQRARVVSSFLKWMITTWIDGYDRYLDQSANHFFEKGLMVSHVGWEKRRVSRLREFDFEEIAEKVPELAEILRDPANDAMLVSLMIESFEGVTERRAKKALKQLRKDGIAYLPVTEEAINRPTVAACAPDSDVLFPSWCIDPKRAPYAFYRDYLTPQEILSRVETDGWNKEWAEYVIEHYLGMSTLELETQNNKQRGARLGRYQNRNSELIEVLWMYQRLVDEDGAEGIYCTVFHPSFAGDIGPRGDRRLTNYPDPWAKRELLSDYTEFPFVVTDLSSSERRMYEVTTFPDLMRSAQHSIKTERDARIDRNSLATVPPIFHPRGRAPHDWGPGRFIGYDKPNEVYYGDVPGQNTDSIAMDAHLNEQIDKLLGLDAEDPDSSIKKGYYIQKYLKHQRAVIAKAFELYKTFGPEELFFRVTGLPEQMQMVKNEDEELDININFDTLYNDPDSIEKAIQMLFQLVPMDQGGRINMDALITFAASVISPTLAGQILQPSQEGSRDLLVQFSDDWSKIWSGIEMDAPPNGFAVIMPALQGLQQQADVVQRYQGDEAFRKRVDRYSQGLMFQQQQQTNAETGRRGADPSQLQLNPAPYPQNGARQ